MLRFFISVALFGSNAFGTAWEAKIINDKNQVTNYQLEPDETKLYLPKTPWKCTIAKGDSIEVETRLIRCVDGKSMVSVPVSCAEGGSIGSSVVHLSDAHGYWRVGLTCTP